MSGAKCTICPHPQRASAEKAIASGLSVRSVAKQQGLPYASLDRHIRNCAKKAMARRRERMDEQRGQQLQHRTEVAGQQQAEHDSDLVARVKRLQSLTDQIIVGAMSHEEVDADGVVTMVRASPGVALKAIAQQRRNYELEGRLTGTLEPESKKDTQLITFESFELLYRRVKLERS